MFRDIWKEIRKDRTFYAALALYGVAVWLFTAGVGKPHEFEPLIYLPRWAGTLWLIFWVALVWAAILSLREPHPLAALKGRLLHFTSAATAANILLYISLSLMNGFFTSAKRTLPSAVDFYADPPLARIDAALHGQDPWLYLQWLAPFTQQISYLYLNGWITAVVGFSALATLHPRLRDIRSHFLWTFFLCWCLLGNLMALVGMSAGPIMYENVTGYPRFADLVANLESHAGNAISSVRASRVLWNNYLTDTGGLGSGISAFPSLHVAMATLFALYALRVNRWFGAVFVVFAGLILVSSVYLGWHYAIDGYASIAATIGLWKFVGWRLACGTAPSKSAQPIAVAAE